jgi:hypothetical protein
VADARRGAGCAAATAGAATGRLGHALVILL